MKLHVLALRERLLAGTLSALWWTDTRDMLADGFTKGSVPRDQLLLACNQGVYKTTHQAAVTRCIGGKKVTSGPSIAKFDGESFSDNAEGEPRSGCAFIIAIVPYRLLAESYFYYV